MTKQILKIHRWTAVVGGSMILAGCQGEFHSPPAPARNGFPDYPLTNQLAELNASVTLQVPVTGMQILSHPHQQWFFNGFPLDLESAKALGVTGFDTKTLTIDRVQLINCGFYSYQNENDPEISKAPLSRQFSETSELLVLERSTTVPKDAEAEAITVPLGCVVSGTPVAGAGGVAGACPGKYVGYVEYDNPNDPSHGWYLTNTNVRGAAYDANPTHANTEVYYIGVPSTNWGCGTNIPASKYPYHFRIYFKTGSVPSGAYGLTMIGFNI